MKRLFTALLTLAVLAVQMMVPVSAEETGTYKIRN
jgi:hypothetical protein